MWMMLFQSDFKEIMSKFFPKDLSRSQNIINKIAEKISELDHEIQLSYEDIRAKRIEFDKQDDQQILTDSLLKNRFYKSQSLLITELLTPHTNKFDLLYDLVK